MLMATYGISFKESKYGWMIGSDKVEMIGSYPCKIFIHLIHSKGSLIEETWTGLEHHASNHM